MLEVKETAREGEEKQSNFNFNVAFYWVGAALSLSLLTGAIGWSYQLIVRDISQIPIIRAQLGPLRVAPDDPGGLTAANQGLSVTQLAVNERPLLSDEIFLAPAAEVLSEENVAISASLDVPCTLYPFSNNNFDRYAPSWPEIPKIKATLLIIKSKISCSF